METGKRAILAAVVVFVIFGSVFSGDIIYADEAYGQLNEPVGSGHPGAGTNTYLFSPSSSSVVRTGGFAGVNETYVIEGQLQLTADFDAETASFDVVDANLIDPLGNLSASERDLGELFEMTELVADSVSESGIYFTNYEPGLFGYEIELFLFFQDISSSRGYVTLFGTHSGPCYDCYRYEINATMVKKMVFYVDADATGANDGSSWENAYNHLQDALAGALSGDEIMVAQGSYTPDSNSAVPDGSGDRGATFKLIEGVTIKGGYAGGGEANPDARDIEGYQTILSGDLDGDDEPDFVNNGENSSPVVTSWFVDETAVLDGFTITAGNGSEGGGLYNSGVNPTIANCTFIGNLASNRGGALYSNSHLTLSGCTFSGNKAVYGGAIYNCYSYPVMTNCIFIGNTAQNGGAIVLDWCSYAIMDNCMFVSNSAEIDGGGMYSCDCCFGNSTLTNCIFWGNSDANGIGSSAQIYNHGWCNAIVNYSCIKGGYPGVGNIQVDPQFVDSNEGDYHLKSEGWRWCEDLLDWQYDDVTSRCIDSGNPGSLLGEELLTIPGDPNHERGENIRINMGVFGGTAQASMGPYGWALLRDLNNDGSVGYIDLGVQVEDWLMNDNAQPGDLNRDGIVNLLDFVLLTEDGEHWGEYPLNPNPEDGSTDVAYGTVLRWSAGDKTVYQDVYFGQSYNAVRDANSSSPEYKGQIAVDTFDPDSFELMKTYYWRVDQLDGSSELIVKGPIWRFSSDECVTVEDFDSYDDDGNSIGDVWVDKLRYGEMQITVQNDPVISPVNSMRLRYHTAYIPYYNLAVRSFSPAQDWTVLSVEVLTIHCYGTADNFDLPMFVTVGDGTTDANVVVTDVNTTVESWQEINVSLSEIAAAGVDLNSVSYMEIGFGDGTDLGMHGSKWDIIYISFVCQCLNNEETCFSR